MHRQGFVYSSSGIAADGRVLSTPLRARGAGLPSIELRELERCCIEAWKRFFEGLHWRAFEDRTEELVCQQKANQVLVQLGFEPVD